jgi:hypothetical protein
MKKRCPLFIAAALAAGAAFPACPIDPETAPIVLQSRDVPRDFLAFITHFKMDGNLANVFKNTGAVWGAGDLNMDRVMPTVDYKEKDPAEWEWANLERNLKGFRDNNIKLWGGLFYGAPWTSSYGSSYITEEHEDAYIRWAVETYKKYYKDFGLWITWNEPDLDGFWKGGKAEESAKRLYAMTWKMARALREEEEKRSEQDRVDYPFRLIGVNNSSGATDTWFRGYLLHTGDGVNYMFQYLDYVGVHPYVSTGEGSAHLMAKYQQLLKPFGLDDKIVNSEFGYNTASGHQAINAVAMPSETIKSLTYNAAQNVQILFWYHLYDDTDSGFGVVVYDGAGSGTQGETGHTYHSTVKTKTAFPAIALWGRYVPGSSYISDFPDRQNLTDDIKSFYFRRPTAWAEAGTGAGAEAGTGAGALARGAGEDTPEFPGANVLILWNSSSSASQDVTVTLPGSGWKEYNSDVDKWTSGNTAAYNWQTDIHPAEYAADIDDLYPRGGRRVIDADASGVTVSEASAQITVSLGSKPLIYIWQNPAETRPVIAAQ